MRNVAVGLLGVDPAPLAAPVIQAGVRVAILTTISTHSDKIIAGFRRVSDRTCGERVVRALEARATRATRGSQ